jgi:hypothetical protein
VTRAAVFYKAYLGLGNLYMVQAQKGKYPYSYFIAAACFGIQAIGIGTYVSFGVLFYPLIYFRGLFDGFPTWGLS